MDRKQDYQYYKEHNICVWCRQENAFFNHVLCPKCIERQNAYWHTYTDERKKELSKRSNDWKRQNKLKGLCKCCGKPVSRTSKTFCEEHRLKYNEYKREYRRKRKIYKTDEERAVIHAEHMRKLREGYRRYQETEKAKINNAMFKERIKKLNKLTFIKKVGVKDD